MFTFPFRTRAPKRPREDSGSESDTPDDRKTKVQLLIKDLKDFLAKFKDQREGATLPGLKYLHDLESLLFGSIVTVSASCSTS